MKLGLRTILPFFLLMPMIAALGGCGGTSTLSHLDSSGLNVVPNEFVRFFDELGIDLADIEGGSADGALMALIASGDVALDRIPNGENAEGVLILRNTHTGGGFIALLRPNRRAIGVLHEVLGEKYGVNLPDSPGLATAEGRPILLYVVGRRADGGARIYVGVDSLELMKSQSFSGDPLDNPDGSETVPPVLSAEEEYRIMLADFKAFSDWTRASDLRIVPTTQAAESSAMADEQMNNLVDLATTYTSTVRFNPWGKNIQINVYNVSMYDFVNKREWYWVKEETLLDGSYEFKPEWREEGNYNSPITGEKIWVGGGECVENFMYEYTINNNVNMATLHQSSPEAANGVQQHTTSTNFGLGASITGGYAAKSPTLTGTLSANIGFSDSTTWTTTDMSVMKRTGNDGYGGIGWDFYCANLPARDFPSWELTDNLPALTHSTYSPSMEWIWSFNNADVSRPERKFSIDLSATRAGLYTYWSGTKKPILKKAACKTTFEVTLPKPPDFALEKTEVNIAGAGTGEFIGVAAEGGWTADISEGAAWLQVSTTPETLTIYANPNTSGIIRKGTILVRRNKAPQDETPAVAAITVTQTP